MATVAFVGLGAMGARMARRLLDAGNRLVVWNRTPAKAEPLAAAGATVASTPAGAARDVDVVITMVSDPGALRDVTSGDDGVIAGLASSATLIEMSTVGPAAVSRLASRLPPGQAMLDAPVLGSVAEAESGSLRIFVGGPAPLFERWRGLLSALGSPVHVGLLGSGARSKLVANLTLFGVLGVLGEALALADRLGLSREVAFEVLAGTPLREQAERRRPSIESGRYPARFRLSLGLKDATLIQEAAGEAGADLRVLEAARSWLADAVAEGRGDEDYSAVLATILRTS
jgi:3-hydroxyisobutyrate dehydrogenase/2-hydroxy-3-oxopropionate reductase